MAWFIHKGNEDKLHEQERCISRWLIVAISLLWFYGYNNERLTISVENEIGFLIAMGYSVVNLVHYFYVKTNHHAYLYLKSIFFYTDSLLFIFVLLVAPEVFAFFSPLLLFLLVSLGMRYGSQVMLRVNGATLLAFSFIVYHSIFWQDHLYLVWTIYVMLTLIPFYLRRLLHKIEDINNKLHNLASVDPLTSLHNRRELLKRLEEIALKSKKHHKTFAVFYFDLDNFKQVNDQFGHDTGDSLLVAVARYLTTSFGQEDSIFRLGGDEFFMVADVHEKDAAIKIAQKIMQAVSLAVQDTCPQLNVSSSVGIAMVSPEHHLDGNQIITKADKAMYHAKNNGKAGYSFAA